MSAKTAAVLFVHAAIGWALCGATIGVGFALTTETAALWIHLLATPLFFVVISGVYFRVFGYTGPLVTAAVFTAVPAALDAGIVAPFIERSYAMFANPLGTWLPFAAMFATTWLVGRWVQPAPPRRTAAA